ncbi:MAG: patatin-like phospholipase family protein [Thermoanaerobaculia bacterium]
MNLPVEVVRAMGADIVIAVDAGDLLETRERLSSAVSIVGQLSTLLTRSNVEAQAKLADVVLRPPVEGFQTADFDRHDEIMPRGIVEAEAQASELMKYAVSDAEYGALIARQRNVTAPEIIIDAIEVSGEHHVDERIIRRLVTSKVGTPLDIDRVEKDIERIYGLGEFVGVSFGVLTASGKHVLHLAVREKPWGPHYGRIGVTMTATAPDEVKVQLLGGVTNTRINARGGEFRLDLVAGEQPLVSTEFIQPFDFDGLHFLSLSGTAGSREVERVVDGHPVALYEVDQQRLSAEYGVRFGSYGEGRFGLMHRWTSARQTVGPPERDDIGGRDAGFHLSLGIDQLDNPFVPRNGAMAMLDAHYVLESLGSEYDYGRAGFTASYFKTWHRHTLMLGLDAGSWLGAPGPAHDAFVLGGFFGLSAYDLGHRTGNAAAMARLGYYAKVADVGAALGRGVYVGAIVEAGNTFPSLSDATDKGTLWSAMPIVAVDSLLGPIYLGYAVGEDNEKNFYLTIGRTF